MLFFAVAGIACGDSAGTGGSQDGGGGATPSWQGHRVLRLDLAASSDDPDHCFGQGSVTVSWGVVLDVTVEGASGSGWLAGTEVQTDAGPLRITAGSSAVEAAVADNRLSLADFEGALTPSDHLHFSTFELVAKVSDRASGEAMGTWTFYAGGDFRCELPFTATIEGGPDLEAPSFWPPAVGVSPLLPFEPITFLLSEPIAAEGPSASAVVDARPVDTALELEADPGRQDFVRALSVASPSSWPAGAVLGITIDGLRDAAGNQPPAASLAVQLAAAPESDANLGFELGLAGWLTDPLPPEQPGVFGLVFPAAGYEVTDDQGKPFLIAPVEGQVMIVVGSTGRLIGHMLPTADATTLALSLAVADPDVPGILADAQGYHLTLLNMAGETVASLEGDPALFPNASAAWSGFARATLPLPTKRDGGLWLLVETVGFAPPVHIPDLIVDDIQLTLE